MPVPTETFRSIGKLNGIFAVSALALLLSVLWMVVDDYNREYRQWQRQGRVWQTAMTSDKEAAARDARTQARINRVKGQIADIQSSLEQDQARKRLNDLAKKIAEYTAELDKLTLRTATKKGEIGPLEQQLQNALLEVPVDDESVRSLKDRLREVKLPYQQNNERMAQFQKLIDQYTKQRDDVLSEQNRRSGELKALTRQLNALTEKLNKLDPKKIDDKLGNTVRDMPLLDWMNPYEKPHQIVVPQVLMDLNTHLIETIDRCQSCHVNIDNPAFSESNVLLYAERQLAQAQDQPPKSIGSYQPVVMLDFWVDAALGMGRPVAQPLDRAVTEALEKINDLRREHDQPALPEAEGPSQRLQQAMAQFQRNAAPAGSAAGSGSGEAAPAVAHDRWYGPMAYFLADVKAMLADHVGPEQFRLLRELYRHELLANLNAHRSEQSLAQLKAGSVMLAHPRLELFVDPESPHSAKAVGCTVCHEGSGQETIFEHTAHTPRDIWVDKDSGAPVPNFLIRHAAEAQEHHESGDDEPAVVRNTHAGEAAEDAVRILPVSLDSDSHGTATPHGSPGHATGLEPVATVHDGVNLNADGDPAPFAPAIVPHDEDPRYAPPGVASGDLRPVVRQQKFWKSHYGWAHVHYAIWEKPMHKLDYVESSCNKCHGEIYDLKDAAPRLFEGRRLFARLGCVNCHSVSGIEDNLDIRKVGPSLVHVKRKLSGPMVASWIWSPRALRPTTRMPHYFMQENNSSKVDILRTRVEVAAMAHYLLSADPGPSVADNPPVYEPKARPDDSGDAARGRELFHQVGCLACHSNLNEHGRQWIVEDLVGRMGLDQEQAAARHDEQMDTNQRHQYVLEHLEERLAQTGPELSAVGTKLLASRTRDQARDWLFNWLLDPRNYHSYTIMPRLRLSEQEAADLTEYLLDQTRDDYEPHDFALTDGGRKMLTELVVNLKASQSTPAIAREEVEEEGQWPQDRKLMFLGEKMISHYGCNGCHVINGFEEAVSACTTLDGWGLKDPHKIDYGHFEHAYDRIRDEPRELKLVRQHGLTADAPRITPDSDRIESRSVAWEEIPNERRPWLYHKLHNPRAFDRARTNFDGDMDEASGRIDVGRPYDKLKMPRFFLTDNQVTALVTYVTSIRKPLVSPQLQEVSDDVGRRITRGRQIATLYNCYGCHNIEGNDVHVHRYFGVYDEDGRYDDDSLNWAPPRLLGQGAKTQGQWLFGFLQNPQTIRPWLRIRMPSFPMTEDHARGLVDYFAGHGSLLSRRLEGHVKVIDAHKKKIDNRIRRESPKGTLIERLEALDVSLEKLRSSGETARGSDTTGLGHLQAEKVDIEFQIEELQNRRVAWYDSDEPGVAEAVDQIRRFAIASDLVVSVQIDPRHADDEDLRDTWDRLLAQVRVLASVYKSRYPYTPSYDPEAAHDDPAQADIHFARGKELFTVMGCMTGLCHRVGDEHLLARNKMLVATSLADTVDDSEDEEEEDEGYDEYGEEDEGESATLAVRPEGPSGGAPNLRTVPQRLQPDWVRRWLVHSATILPGTKMLEFFNEGKSFFHQEPPEKRTAMEKLFGYTADQQRDLLIDFLYSAGRRRVTLAPDGKILEGGPGAPIELTTLEPPPDLPEPVSPQEATPDTPQDGGTQAPAPAAPKAPPPPPELDPEPETSQIPDWHDAAAEPYGGDAVHGHKTRVIGVVKYKGRKPRMRPVSMTADKVCAAGHQHPVLPEQLVVTGDGSLVNALVYVKEGLPRGLSFDPPKRAEIRQIGCIYKPHVTAVMVGQPLTIWNDDNTAHNVKIKSKRNRAENFNQPTAGVKNKMTPKRAELNIPMACNYHPWMSGVLHVLEHPYFGVSDVEGRFEIPGLPPGNYTLEVLHESPKISPVTFEVEIAADTSHRAEDVTVRGRGR